MCAHYLLTTAYYRYYHLLPLLTTAYYCYYLLLPLLTTAYYCYYRLLLATHCTSSLYLCRLELLRPLRNARLTVVSTK